jgi:hypothetical protein
MATVPDSAEPVPVVTWKTPPLLAFPALKRTADITDDVVSSPEPISRPLAEDTWTFPPSSSAEPVSSALDVVITVLPPDLLRRLTAPAVCPFASPEDNRIDDDDCPDPAATVISFAPMAESPDPSKTEPLSPVSDAPDMIIDLPARRPLPDAISTLLRASAEIRPPRSASPALIATCPPFSVEIPAEMSTLSVDLIPITPALESELCVAMDILPDLLDVVPDFSTSPPVLSLDDVATRMLPPDRDVTSTCPPKVDDVPEVTVTEAPGAFAANPAVMAIDPADFVAPEDARTMLPDNAADSPVEMASDPADVISL